MDTAVEGGSVTGAQADLHGLSALLDAQVSRRSFEDFLHAWSELEKRIHSRETELRRRHYAHTSDEDAKAAFEQFNREVMPEVDKARLKLVDKYLVVAHRFPKYQHGYLFNRFSVDQRLNVENNAEAKAAEAVLSNRFSTIVGGLQAVVDGRPLPLSKVAALQREPSRDIRESAWRAEMEARLSVARELGELYLELVSLRQTIAQNAGFSNYLEYRWLERGRFDYSPAQCIEFVKAISLHFGGLLRQLMEQRRQKLGVDSLRPWDINGNPEGLAPLRPYQSIEELVNKAFVALQNLDLSLARLLQSMDEHGNLDLEPRANKSPSTFTDFYYDQRRPLIFMSANGTPSSVFTFFHELGHANHWMQASARQPLFWYQYAPAEFQEAVAQALELLMLSNTSPFFSEAELPRVIKGKVIGLLYGSTSMLAKEMFQHWVYTQPTSSLSLTVLQAKYQEIAAEFDQPFDYTGLERFQATTWQGGLLFWQPLYSIEYAVAWVGALLFLRRYLEDPASAMAGYGEALAQGMSLPMRDLFATVQVGDPLHPDNVKAAAGFLREHLASAFT